MAIFLFQQNMPPPTRHIKPAVSERVTANFTLSGIVEHGRMPIPHNPGLLVTLYTTRIMWIWYSGLSLLR